MKKADTPQYLDDEQPEFGRPDSEAMRECDSCHAQRPDDTEPCPECGDGAVDEDDAANKRAVHLDTLGQTMLAKFKEDERKRIYIEDRWLEDLRQYHGRYDPNVETELNQAQSCALFLNISKSKTNAYSARVIDMVLPTDEKNWDLKHTPVPELVAHNSAPDKPAMETGPDGTQTPVNTTEGHPVLNKDMTKGITDEASSRAEAMSDEIDDQLTEAGFNAIQRKGIDQMAKLGTAVVMGPVIIDEWRVKWEAMPGAADAQGQPKMTWVRKLVPNEDKRPGAQWIDCWHFYPDMSGNCPEEWGHANVQHLWNLATFKKMAKRFNFMPDAMERACQGNGNFNITALRWMNELRQLSETQNITDNRFRVLRYYGGIDREDLEVCGMDPAAMGIEEGADIFGVVWHCDGIVLKVDINPLDSGEMPFSVAYCDKDEASPFGIGIPRLMRGEQESVNAAWRMKHDNAALSVCPQTVVKFNAITPSDGDWHLKPKKVWFAGDEVQNVNNVFAQFAVDSHQEELDNILQLGIRFADDVTQLPLLMQGDQAPHITQTAQGMSLLYNASTVVLRRTVKFYDDYMTGPTISRFYQWNMQFNPRDDIKGDFRCVPRGSSTLLDKEQQGQALDVAMQLAMQPTWQPYTDMKKLYRLALKSKRIEDILLDDDTIEKNLKDQAAAAQAAAQAGAPQGGGAAPPDPAIENRKLDIQQAAVDARNRATDSAERIAVQRISHEKGMSTEQAAAHLAGIKIGKSADIEMFNAETALKEREGSGI